MSISAEQVNQPDMQVGFLLGFGKLLIPMGKFGQYDAYSLIVRMLVKITRLIIVYEYYTGHLGSYIL